MAGEGQEPEVVPAADDNEHGHEGSFATGQETTEHHPEREEEEGRKKREKELHDMKDRGGHS